MRKIIAGLFISLDGVVEAPDQWHFPYFDDAMGEAVGGMLEGADTMIFGRVTYDGFAEAWPPREAAGEEDAVFAKILGDARKVVASKGDRGPDVAQLRAAAGRSHRGRAGAQGRARRRTSA